MNLGKRLQSTPPRDLQVFWVRDCWFCDQEEGKSQDVEHGGPGGGAW